MYKKLSGYDFIKKSIPKKPLFRFKGKTIKDYKKWSKASKAKLLDIMGYNNIEAIKSEAKLVNFTDFSEYTRFEYKLNTAKGLTMPYYVLEPKISNNKAVIALHGHGSDGKEGLVGNEGEDFKKSIERFNYTYALEFLKKGYTVYVPDLLGAGKRTLGIYSDNRAECNDINNALISVGMCMQAVILFENIQLVKEINKKGYDEIVCCGFSGGGHSALWLALMESKIERAYISGFFHSFKYSLIYQNRCGCNFIPYQWKYVDMGDILAMAAPKKIYIETGKEDNLNGIKGIDGVMEQLESANKTYSQFNEKIDINICEGSHRWYGSFMDKF